MCVRLLVPLQWKGGMLTELYKNKGPQSDISSYRDIFLGDYDGKGFTKIIRKTLLPMASNIVGFS